MDTFITTNSKQTQKLGEMLASELRSGPASSDKRACLASRGGEILCLTGELGSGKTTFAQGILKRLKVKGPYTSPTFVIVKRYKIKKLYQSSAFSSRQRSCRDSSKPSFIYHIDAYRVGAKDILDLGWQEITASKNNIIIVEWAERIKRVIPESAVWLKFKHKGKEKREISIK